jgi:ATP-binding cassette subfamily B (MDR/TAP) protein 1
MSELGSSSHDSQATIMKWGMLVLITAVAFGAAVGLRFFILENCAMHWLGSLRANSFAKIMAQDKAWFDDSQNSPERIVGIVMKDGDDARTLIATVASQSFAVIAMLGLGIGWALVIGWQLTCVGFVLVPVFGGIMAFQSHYSDKFELKSKRAREEVARNYFEVVANVRAIRSMALESVFEKHFLESLKQARRTCLRGSVLSGVSFGLANALVYLAEALVFFVGAALMARGTYSYLQLVEVIDLILFTVNLGSQMMTFG